MSERGREVQSLHEAISITFVSVLYIDNTYWHGIANVGTGISIPSQCTTNFTMYVIIYCMPVQLVSLSIEGVNISVVHEDCQE